MRRLLSLTPKRIAKRIPAGLVSHERIPGMRAEATNAITAHEGRAKTSVFSSATRLTRSGCCEAQ